MLSKRDTTTSIVRGIKTQVTVLGGFVTLIWVVEILDLLLGGSLDVYGIIPHSIIGLRGIIFAPFLHGGFAHLAANTIPLVTLGWLIMLRSTRDFFVVTAVTMLISGVGTWLFGAPNSLHIGASGLVFGYLGFLLLRGYFERSVVAISLSLFVGLVYGSAIWGVLPLQIGISWQGHLFGFIGGVMAARFLAKRKRRSPTI